MSENDTSQDKTEQPTAKRLKDAKEKGQVARSKDLNTLVILLAGSAGMILIGDSLGKGLSEVMMQSFSFNIEHLITGKLNQEIPHGLYVAVAQVLAYIFQLRQQYKTTYEQTPRVLEDLEIPEEFRHDEEVS